jgi:hypothetical protein
MVMTIPEKVYFAKDNETDTLMNDRRASDWNTTAQADRPPANLTIQ